MLKKYKENVINGKKFQKYIAICAFFMYYVGVFQVGMWYEYFNKSRIRGLIRY